MIGSGGVDMEVAVVDVVDAATRSVHMRAKNDARADTFMTEGEVKETRNVKPPPISPAHQTSQER